MNKQVQFVLVTLVGFTLFMSVNVSFALKPTHTIDFFLHNVWTVEDGLPMNSVISIVQTPDGYLWLGTESGLARFDGLRFEIFDHENTPELSTDLIRSLLADRNGTLWIATRGSGVVRYEHGRFHPLTTQQGLLSNEAWTIMESRDGSIWIGSRKGVNRFHDGRLTVIPLPAAMPSHNIRALLEDRLGRVWVGARGGGLALVKKRGDGFDTQYKGLKGLNISTLLEDRRGGVWVGTMAAGLIRLLGNRRKDFTTANGLSNNYVRCLYEDHAGNLWVGTQGGGLSVRQSGQNNFTPFNDRGELTSHAIYTLYEDREHTLWIGTEGGGLNSLRDSKITTYTMKNGLSYDIVFSVFQDSSDRVWVGTMGFGVNYLAPGEKQFHALTTRDGLSADSVLSIAEYPEGSLWFGTLGGGVNRLKDGKFEVFTTRDGLSDNFVRALYVDPVGVFWAGTDNGGLHRFENGRFKLCGNTKFRINSIYKDSGGNLWIGTWGGGLCRFNDGEIEVFDKQRGLSGNNVMCIYEDSQTKGVLWLGAYGGGLNRLETGAHYKKKGAAPPAAPLFRNISKKDGLPDDTIYWILEAGSDDLWMSTNRGIFCVKRKELDDFAAGRRMTIHSTLYRKEDGMKSIECNGANQPAGFRTRDGKLWFPTTKGVSVVDPDNVGINCLPPPVQIEAVTIDGNAYCPGQAAIAPPGGGDLEIRYTGLSFIVSKKIMFKYKLEGYDEQWINAGADRTAVYRDVPPGAYRFRVIACNNDNVWNTTGASFEFQLEPKYYQTLFFKIAAPVAVLFLFTAFFLSSKKVIYFHRLKKKYKGSSLDPQEAEECIRKILYSIEIETMYRDANLSLDSLSKKLKVSPRYISQVINERLKKNFYELVNYYRVKEAQQMLASPADCRRSILEIGYEVGFNSKSAFNRAFKNFTRMTPSQFRKRNKCSDS